MLDPRHNDPRRRPAGRVLPVALLIVAVGAGALVYWQRDALFGPPARPPNVILIGLDTLRADALGCLGAAGDPSPHLDRFAAGAVLFENATSAACWTLPSFASIFTGLYPEAHGTTQTGSRLAEGFVTLAEILHEAGLRTAAFTGGGYVGPKFGFKQGFECFNFRGSYFLRDALPLGRSFVEHQGDQPFFLFLHGYDVHSPYAPRTRPEPPAGYQPPAMKLVDALVKWAEQGADDPALTVDRVQTAYLTLAPEGDLLGRFRRAYLEWSNRLHGSLEPLWMAARGFEQDLAWLKANYAAETAELDADLGPFLAFLEDSGALENTLVVILSDHGEAFMEHGVCEHYRVDEAVARIPLIIRPPGAPRAARRVTEPVRSIDLLPTILAYCGLEPPELVQGRSLKPLIDGETLPAEPACCFQNQVHLGTPPLFSIRQGDWKLVTGGHEHDPRLFDLAADRSERSDLAAERPDHAARLAELLERIRANCRNINALHGPAAATLDRETLEQLTELGYLGEIRPGR